jgi:RNA polymerase sigma-70 factor, ECF subfamily
MNTTTERVWETFHAPLEQFIRHRVSDDATAEDLLQDVFLKIHQHVETLRDVKKLESWIYKLTRNAIIDYYRSIKPTTSLVVPEALLLPEELPDEDVVSELFPSVRAMVMSLPAQDRQALILTEYQGLTQKELADRLGLSLSGAKSRVRNSSNSYWTVVISSWIGEVTSSTINHDAHVARREPVMERYQHCKPEALDCILFEQAPSI